MKIKNILGLTIITAALLSSCSKEEISTFAPTITINKPTSLATNMFTWETGTMTFKEINTGKVTNVPLPLSQFPEVSVGEYIVTVDGTIEYNTDGFDDDGNPSLITATAPVRGSKENVTINNNGVNISIDLMVYNNESSFVISEIYVTGSLNAAGTSGIIGDKFFRIYNNSIKTQYADGLALLESVITTTDNFTYSPDFRNEGFGTQVVYVIPGNGKDYPLAPGESIVIADQASNHKAGNSNALDLSNADFEWYDYTDKGTDTDNPQVTNLDRWYSYSSSIWTPSNQGNRAYAIARIGVSKDEFLADGSKYYHSDWSYVNSGKVLYKKGYLIDHAWILDAVNISPSTNFSKLATSVALDKSFVSIANTGTDATRFGKSIVRKSSGKIKDENGNLYSLLIDTDNSKNDFTVETVSIQ